MGAPPLVVLLVVALLVVVVVAVGVAVVVSRQKRAFAKANEVLPGIGTNAPASWAGDHSPEARLHRRLRDAMAALRQVQRIEDGTTLDQRVTLEQQALAVDQQLIASAALPERHRADPLAEAAAAVTALEDAVALLSGSELASASDACGLADAMAEVRARTAALGSARSRPHVAPAEAALDVPAAMEPDRRDTDSAKE